MPIRQLFFDCDNTLVVTEDLVVETSAELVNQILAEHGIQDRYTTEQLLTEFIGLSFRGMVVALQKKYSFEIPSDRLKYYTKQEELAVMTELQDKARPATESKAVLEQLHTEGKYNLAVVSSSALNRIQVAIENAGLADFFQPDHVYSAVTSLDKPASKPSPAVYIHAMEKLGVRPEECLTVEDSKSGALSAIRAKINCIAYVGAYSTRQMQEQVGKTLMDLGCIAVMYNWNEYFAVLEKIELEMGS